MMVGGQKLKIGTLETCRAGKKKKLDGMTERHRQPGCGYSAYEHRDKRDGIVCTSISKTFFKSLPKLYVFSVILFSEIT